MQHVARSVSHTKYHSEGKYMYRSFITIPTNRSSDRNAGLDKLDAVDRRDASYVQYPRVGISAVCTYELEFE